MTIGQFQSFPAAYTLGGDIKAEVLDPGNAPSTIVCRGDDWKVSVTWSLNGDLVDMITGTWKLKIVADPGVATATQIATPDIPLTPGNPNYTVVVPMKDKLAPEGYELRVELIYLTGAGLPGKLAGFVQLPNIMVTS